MNKEESIGFHKGALMTLINERKELIRLLNVTNSLMEAHIKALRDLGVSLKTKSEKKR
ncbi:MAG: hypothetical protein AABX59_00795 [Nanoarchaeota archaeon]